MEIKVMHIVTYFRQSRLSLNPKWIADIFLSKNRKCLMSYLYICYKKSIYSIYIYHKRVIRM